MRWFFGNKEKRRFERDRFGEWAIVTSNKDMSFVVNSISKSLSKIGLRKSQIYVLQYSKDNLIPNFFSVKGMIKTFQNVSEALFQNSLRKSFDDLGNLGEIRTAKVRLCNEIFLFFNFNFVARKVRPSKCDIKLLIPPLGVSSSQIPYTVEGLFNSMIGTDSDPCLVETDFMDSRIAKITFNCRKINLDEFRIRESFSYFLDDVLGLRVKTKSSDIHTTEIEIVLLNLKREYLIPLIWDNFLSIYPSC